MERNLFRPILTKFIENAENLKRSRFSEQAYLNVSTRFSDGGESGFGGEIEFHAKPMPVGLWE